MMKYMLIVTVILFAGCSIPSPVDRSIELKNAILHSKENSTNFRIFCHSTDNSDSTQKFSFTMDISDPRLSFVDKGNHLQIKLHADNVDIETTTFECNEVK